MDIISMNTVIPLSLLSVVIGFTVWLSKLYSLASINRVSIKDLKREVHNSEKLSHDATNHIIAQLQNINGRLSNIEGKLSK